MHASAFRLSFRVQQAEVALDLGIDWLPPVRMSRLSSSKHAQDIGKDFRVTFTTHVPND